jgi:hypothetical protein
MTDQNTRLKIPSRDIFNIFQIFNPEVFTLLEDEDESGNIYNNMLVMLKKLGAPTADIMENTDAVREYSSTIISSDAGGFVMNTMLKTVSKNAEIEEWIFLIIGDVIDYGEDVKEAADRYKLNPLFALTGTFEQNRVFVPHDCIARMKTKNGEDARMLPNTADDFYALILYADSAFRAIMTHEKMNMDTFAFYLDPSQVALAKYDYNEIKKRTATDLAAYVLECAEENQPQIATTYPILPAPPILQ